MYVIGEEEIEAVRRVIESRRLFRYQGARETETMALEREWAALTGSRYAIAMTSGTAALISGLAGLGVGPGDEVAVPAYTFVSTALAPLAVGAVPVLVEIDESLTMDPDDLERKLTPHAKAVIPVHMAGLPCDMDRIMEVARARPVAVVEDACQADGGSYRGRRLGTMGAVGTYSFNHFKIITAGEGGALVTDDRAVYERAMIKHDAGCVFFSEEARQAEAPIFAGLNFRLSEVLAAIARVQVKRLDGILEALRAEKRLLVSALADVRGFGLGPVRDPDGDCGTTLALTFESNGRARRFIARVNERVPGAGLSTPIDSGRHVYTNWEPIMAKRGSHHPGYDPFVLAGREYDYAPDMCPRTLDVLARTVFVPTRVDRSREDLEALARALVEAGA